MPRRNYEILERMRKKPVKTGVGSKKAKDKSSPLLEDTANATGATDEDATVSKRVRGTEGVQLNDVNRSADEESGGTGGSNGELNKPRPSSMFIFSSTNP